MAKTSKSERSDRQKVIDDIRRKQKSAESRQGKLIVGACIAVALAIVVAAAWNPVMTAIQQSGDSGKTLAEIGASAADACQDVITKDATGSGDHVGTGTQVEYEDSPPAFGQHWNEGGVAPAPIQERYYTEDTRPELESLVHNSEHGFTILWYDEEAADDSGMIADIKSIAQRLDDSDTNNRYSFKAVPWTEEDGEPFPDDQHIALTAWTTDGDKQLGVWQYCSEPSGEAVEEFMKDYPYTKAPEPIGGGMTS